MRNRYSNCALCAHACGVDRTAGELGLCGMSDKLRIARAALHKWEEPIISGTRGSGAIFFSGCSLGCVFCQNSDISCGREGKEVSIERLSEIMLELQERGAHNINLVTPTHFSPSIASAVMRAKSEGLRLPIVYNTSSYDSPEALKMLDGIVDVYLPDFKYFTSKTSEALAHAADYPSVAKAAIAEMTRQKPTSVINDGIMESGVIVRILLLPSHVAEAKLILKYLHETYGERIYVSLMSQYTPMKNMNAPLNRRVTRSEYYDFVSYAEKLGIKNGFTQDFEAADEKFIPSFDGTGV